MKKKIIFHILKHELLLKKNSYIVYFSALILLLVFQILVNYYNVNAVWKIVAIITSIVFPFYILNQTFLIPSGAKGVVKFQNGGYSWGYVLTTFRSRENYLFAVIVELLIDISLCLLMISLCFINTKHELIIVCFLMTPLLNYTFRFTKFASVRNANGRSASDVKTLNKSIVYILAGLAGGALFLIDIPSELILYVLGPMFICFYIYLPFLVKRSITYDLNKKERCKLNKQYSFISASLIALGLTCFYFDQIKSGHQIFTEINQNNNSKVHSLILKNKKLLKLKGRTYGLTPLLFAAKKNNTEIVKWILQNGGNVNDVDNTGNNLLTYTAGNCNLELTEYVIDRGVDIKHLPKDKMNALFTAASSNCEVLIRYFKKIGMDEGQVNQKGQNYIEYGKTRNSNFEVLYNFIRKYNL